MSPLASMTIFVGWFIASIFIGIFIGKVIDLGDDDK